MRLFKVAWLWPFDLADMAEFVDGLDMVIVVEEKRSLWRASCAEALYGNRPPACGCAASAPNAATGCSRSRARSIPMTLPSRWESGCSRSSAHAEEIDAKVKRIRQFQSHARHRLGLVVPHALFLLRADPQTNTSTRVPEGSIAARGASDAISCLCGWIGLPPALPRWAAEGAQWVGEGAVQPHAGAYLSESRRRGPTITPGSWHLAIRHRRRPTNINLQDPFNTGCRGDDRRAGPRGQPDSRRHCPAGPRPRGVERIALVQRDPNGIPPGPPGQRR